MNKQILIFLVLASGFVPQCVFSQTFADKLLLTKEHSMNETSEKVYKATQAIRFEAGFSAREGCALFASVGNAGDDLSGKQTDHALGVYPNPAPESVVIKGTFNQAGLTIYDASGNPVSRVLLDGKDPVIKLTLTSGEYVFKAAGLSARVVKQ
jgi:hypothetical protein